MKQVSNVILVIIILITSLNMIDFPWELRFTDVKNNYLFVMVLAFILPFSGLRCHPLKGNRKGQYAVKLTGFYRLIFTVDGNCLDIALIEEVSKHYDD